MVCRTSGTLPSAGGRCQSCRTGEARAELARQYLDQVSAQRDAAGARLKAFVEAGE